MLALVALVGNIANAELLNNFKWDGKIEISAQANNNAGDADSDALDKTSDIDARVQLNASFDITDDVEAVVSAVKANRDYGTASESVAGATADGFFFEQAYLNLKGVLGFDHKIGRQYYGDEGSLVVYYGPRSWPYQYGDAALTNPLMVSGIDGYSGWYKNDKLQIHALTAKIADVDNAAAGIQADTDTDLVGVVGKYDLMEMLNIGAYVYEQKVYGAAAPDLTKDVVGVKATGKILGFDYYGEIAKNYGRKNVGVNYTGSAFLAGAKYDIELAGKWTFMGEMGIGSGDKTSADKDEEFTSIASDYRPGVIFSGVRGNTGLGDLTTWNLGAKWLTPMSDKLTLSGKMYYFSPTEEVTGAGGYDTYGQELDLCAMWQHNENVGLKAYYAMLMVDSDYADAMLGGKDDMMTTIGAALTVKF
jgi:hypothetical protein